MKCSHALNYLRLSDYDSNIRVIDSYDEISDRNILSYLQHLGGVFNALEMFNSGDYNSTGEGVNTTDCITTAKNLWKLFNPKLLQTLEINRDNLISPRLFEGDMNIAIADIGGGLPYHKFILIKTSDSWVILCSYAGEYTLRIIDVVDIVQQLNNLALGSSSEFNTLFQTDEARGTSRYAGLTIKSGVYNIPPVDKLKSWIKDYRDNFILWSTSRNQELVNINTVLVVLIDENLPRHNLFLLSSREVASTAVYKQVTDIELKICIYDVVDCWMTFYIWRAK